MPPARLFCGQRRQRAPYLFREEDLQALLAQAARLGPPDSLRPHTYSTLLGLLAVTGLRISEALALRFKDVTPDGLVIHATKFRKSRLVPLHATAISALQGYLAKRCELALDDDHLFVSGRRRPLSYFTVVDTFHQLLAAAGIPTDPDRPRPRLMDLRHHPEALISLEQAFSKNKRSPCIAQRLANTYKARGDIKAAIHILRECLDHNTSEKEIGD